MSHDTFNAAEVQSGGLKEYRVYGPPGTGKTTWMTRQIALAAKKYGGKRILACSFTRTAAAELTARLEGADIRVPAKNVGTIHSLCFHAAGQPELAETRIADWNDSHPYWQLSKKNTARAIEEGETEDSSLDGSADSLLAQYNILRNQLVELPDMPHDVARFAVEWEAWKAELGLYDFTDLLSITGMEMLYAPNNCTVAFVDEAQDLTPLQLAVVRNWARSMSHFILSGDDDQCQPAGTMVQTTEGLVDIASLDPEKHRLVAYARNDGAVYGWKNGGYGFKKAVRYFEGAMFTIRTELAETRATGNHRWLVRWKPEVKKNGVCVVYLMRRGDDFRIGWCQLFRSDGCLHLGVRAHLEGADAAWILSVHDNKHEASIQESYLSAKFGICTAPFKVHGAPGLYTQDRLDELFRRLSSCAMEHAESLLWYFDLSLRFPIWTRKYAEGNRFGSRTFECESYNLIPKLMLIPILDTEDKKRARWEAFSIGLEPRARCDVYSLDVDTCHTYVADGIITHNCLYTFSGAKPDSLITDGFPSDHKIVLGQSYRIPRAVHRLAEKWISKCKHREPKEYKPAEHEGLVRTMPHATYKLAEAAVRDAEKQLAAGRSVMFLAACSYMLRQSVIPLLKERRIPFWNPYRTTQGEWNPINGARRRKVHAFIYPDGPEGTYAKLWSLDQLEDWLSICNSGSWLKRGAKEALKRVRKAERQQDALYNWYCDYFLQPGFDEAHLCAANASTEWLQKQMPAEKLKSWQYTFDVLEKMADESPRCVVGTIHSVKGGEAEVVYLFPDLSPQAVRNLHSPGGGDDIVRQFYVGLTRARQELVICGPSTRFFADIG